MAAPTAATLTASDRAEALHELGTLLEAHYVFPEVAKTLVANLSQASASGGHDAVVAADDFARQLSQELRQGAQDKHFLVRYDPHFRPEEHADAPPSAEQVARDQADMRQMAWGIEKLERLPGNVGYVELRGFGPTGLVAPAYDQAMALLAGSQALIVDLRRNGGGEPSSVAYFMSHFFPIGDERHLNDIYTRSNNQTQQYWTGPVGSERYDKPVYVLTSARTFSGGEECAYDFQTQHRGVLVGDTTGGGSNPVDVFGLGHGLVVAIPVARAINPITHSNWEHVGVKPDISVPAAQAQQAAYTAILSQLAAQAHEPDEREYLQHLLSLAKQGQSEPPRYTAGP
jgi:C-terminal processing protease CtpA/Prc